MSYANIFPATMKDGVPYAVSKIMASGEADLYNLGDAYSHPPLAGQVIVCGVKLTVTGSPLVNNSYIVLQTDLGDGVWIDVSWMPWTATSGSVNFALASGVLISSVIQQTRSGMPNSAGSNRMPLGGRFRIVGAAQLTGGLAAAVTADIYAKVLTAESAAAGGTGSIPVPAVATANTRLAPSGIRTRLTVLGPTISATNYPPPAFQVVDATLLSWSDVFNASLTATPSTSVFLATVTRIASGGDTITVIGNGFDSSTTFWALGQTTSGNRAFTQCTLLQLVGNSVATVTLPSMPSGMILLYAKDGTNYSTPLPINRTEGTYLQADKTKNAYCASGDTVKVYGFNLCNKTDTTKAGIYIQGYGYVTATVVDANCITFTMPALTVGTTYQLYPTNGMGDVYGWSPPLLLYCTSDAAYMTLTGSGNYAARTVDFAAYSATYAVNSSGAGFAAAVVLAANDLASGQADGTSGRIRLTQAGDYYVDVSTLLNMTTGGCIQLYNDSGGTVRIRARSAFNGTSLFRSLYGYGSCYGLTFDTTLGGDFTNLHYSLLEGIHDVEACTITANNVYAWTISTPTGQIYYINAQPTSPTGFRIKNNTIKGWGVAPGAANIAVTGNTFWLAGGTGAPLTYLGQYNVTFADNTIRDLTDVAIYQSSITAGTGSKGPFTFATGLNWTVGTDVILNAYTLGANNIAGSTLNCTMTGTVAAYNNGTGVTTFSIVTSDSSSAFSYWVVTGKALDRGEGRMFNSGLAGGTNTYIARNTSIKLVSGVQDGQSEQIEVEASLGSASGLVATTPTTSAFTLTGVNPDGLANIRQAFVSAGKGMGQIRQITSAASGVGALIGVDSAWTVPLDTTSRINIVAMPRNWIIRDNTFDGVRGVDFSSTGILFQDGAEGVYATNNTCNGTKCQVKLFTGTSNCLIPAINNIFDGEIGNNVQLPILVGPNPSVVGEKIAFVGNIFRNYSSPTIQFTSNSYAAWLANDGASTDGSTYCCGNVLQGNAFTNATGCAASGLNISSGSSGVMALILVGNTFDGSTTGARAQTINVGSSTIPVDVSAQFTGYVA